MTQTLEQRIGEAALEGLFDRGGIKHLLSEIKETDPAIWNEITQEAGLNAVKAFANQVQEGVFSQEPGTNERTD